MAVPILLVDDDGVDRQFMRAALQGVGLKPVYEAADLRGARLLLTRQPRVVVCDKNLPDGDGCDFLAGLPLARRVLLSDSVPPSSKLPQGVLAMVKPWSQEAGLALARQIRKLALGPE